MTEQTLFIVKPDGVRRQLVGEIIARFEKRGFLIQKLKIFPNELIIRNNIANKYQSILKYQFKCPIIPKGYVSSWAQYSILLENDIQRSKCIAILASSNIPTAIYYSTPLHLQKAFSYLNYTIGDFPISEDISNRILSLPMHPYLSDENINEISEKLLSCKE